MPSLPVEREGGEERGTPDLAYTLSQGDLKTFELYLVMLQIINLPLSTRRWATGSGQGMETIAMHAGFIRG